MQAYCAYCTLYVYGDELEPDDVSRTLALKPDFCGRRGESRLKQDGTASTYIFKRGFWGVSSSKLVKSDQVSAHLAWLMNSVDPDKHNAISSIEDTRISIHLRVDDEESGETIPVECVAYAARMGALFDVKVAYWPDDEDDE